LVETGPCISFFKILLPLRGEGEGEAVLLILDNKLETGISELGKTLEIDNKLEAGNSGTGLCIHRRDSKGGGGGNGGGGGKNCGGGGKNCGVLAVVSSV
jgi:hypothetical protein